MGEQNTAEVVVVDLDQARLQRRPAKKNKKRSSSRKLPQTMPGERYFGGPLPFPWWAAASNLPGRTLHVALAIWHLATLRQRSAVVRIRPSLIRELGVKRNAMYRAIQNLQEAGLIEVVDRARGRSMTVRVRTVDDA